MEIEKTTAILVFNKEGKILLQKRDNKPDVKEAGKWDFWGGHCEEGEAAKICAKRELKEENGIEAKELKFIAKRRFDRAEEYAFAYLLESGEKPPVYEGERCEWFAVEEAQKLAMAFGGEAVLKPKNIQKVKALLGI